MRSAAFALFALIALPLNFTAAQPPAAAPPADAAKLDAHLAAWEKAAAGLTSFRVDVALTRKDVISGKSYQFSGSALCMTPTFARMRLDYAADPKDYEAFICNGKSLYVYNGSAKTVTEHKLPDPKTEPAGATDNLVLDFLFGMKAKAFKERFDVHFLGEDENYVYIDIKPVLAKDKQEFERIRIALYGPNTKSPYLPALIIAVRPNQDIEDWKFTKPQLAVPGIGAKEFQYEEVKGFTLQQAPRRPN